MLKPTISLLLATGIVAAACTIGSGIPRTLEPTGSMLAMVAPASGVQVYECRIRQGDIDAFEWAFVAPDAKLYDQDGKEIGTHGAGPVWIANDGSRVMGKLVARADSPISGSIPWLLLAATSTGPAGRFSAVTSIQRVNTLGGTAPSKPCNLESLGKKAGVHYTADYRFFIQKH